MVEEELVLKPGWAVKRDVAVALTQRLHAALELVGRRGAHSEADPGGEHRRLCAGLELCLVLARERSVLMRLKARPEGRALELVAIRVLDVGDPLSHLPQRVAVA